MSARLAGRVRLLLALVLTIACTVAAPAAASSFYSRVAGHIAAGDKVELKLRSFEKHEGNGYCGTGTPEPTPDLVPAGQKRGFCYEQKDNLGRTYYMTELTFKYSILVDNGRGFVDSGYTLVGHAVIGFYHKTLSCGFEKTDPAPATEHFDCQVTTERDAERSVDPAPTWKVTFHPTPADVPKVIFIGDSVTAGFGYCGTEGGANSADINCRPNDSMADNWDRENGLKACAPSEAVKPVNDRCSNDNSLGAPWSAGPWFPDPNAPNVAYPYVIAKQQSGALAYDWAMTGSTPADWDPAGGAFGNQTKTIKNSWVVMTLGANPLLAAYIKITLAGFNLSPPGQCADTTMIAVRSGVDPPVTFEYAAALDGQKDGVLRCMNEKWDSLRQGTHLLNVYKTLIANGNHVLVLGYPLGCPRTFGTWQPEANVLFGGPSNGHACTSLSLQPIRGDGLVSQFDQARALGNDLNTKIEAVVKQAAASAGGHGKIFFALPNQAAWANHQAWSSDPWVFKNDTWVHPNRAGHKELATTVLTTMCADYKHWCHTPPKWTVPITKPDCRRNPKHC